jgi:hypothetical protein
MLRLVTLAAGLLLQLVKEVIYMANKVFNKVVYNGNTLIDLTGDTIEP